MRKLPLLIFLLIFPISAYGYDQERALNNFSHDLATCSAYYYLFSESPGFGEENKENYLMLSQMLFQTSVKMSNQKVTEARIEISVKEMRNDMDSDWGNASVVLNKYAELCQEVVDNPEKRMEYWFAKKEENGGQPITQPNLLTGKEEDPATFDMAVNGKKCLEAKEIQSLECQYQIGKDLNIAIAGIGQPDTSITFMKSDYDGDFYATYGLKHGCIIIKRGPKGVTSENYGAGSLFDYAFISPMNGKIYKSWDECQNGY